MRGEYAGYYIQYHKKKPGNFTLRDLIHITYWNCDKKFIIEPNRQNL